MGIKQCLLATAYSLNETVIEALKRAGGNFHHRVAYAAQLTGPTSTHAYQNWDKGMERSHHG